MMKTVLLYELSSQVSYLVLVLYMLNMRGSHVSKMNKGIRGLSVYLPHQT